MKTEKYVHLARRKVKARRAYMGLSGQTVAEKVGAPWQTYYGWESERYACPSKMATKIARALRIPREEILR